MTIDQIITPETVRDPPHPYIRSVSTINQPSVSFISSRIITLLLLFHAMGDRIPKILFDRALITQRRIDIHSKHYEVTPKAAGVDKDLTVLLLEEVVFKQAINYLISRSQISLRDSTYFYQDESARALFRQKKDY